MRPGTPTLNGCSLTLFSCQVNLPLQNSSNMDTAMDSDQKKDKKVVKQINFHREKFSLKKNTTSGKKRLVNQKDEKSLSSSQSSISKNINTSQLSVEGKEKPLSTYPINIYTDYIQKDCGKKSQQTQQQMVNSKKQREQYRRHYNYNNQNNGLLPPSINDTIIKQQYKYKQSKDRETANTRTNTNYFSQRRVLTQENKETLDTFHQINLKNEKQTRPSKPKQVYRSEFLKQHNYSDTPSLTVYNSTMMNMNMKNNEANQLNYQRSPALKKSSYINTQAQTQLKTKGSRQIAQQSLKIEEQPGSFVKLIQNSNNFFTNVQVKAPFQGFPKKFKTLIDLNCKNVDSSGGEKTSSNHISILASLDSFKNNHMQSNREFARVIKMMTLKNMPLNNDQRLSKFQNIQ